MNRFEDVFARAEKIAAKASPEYRQAAFQLAAAELLRGTARDVESGHTQVGRAAVTKKSLKPAKERPRSDQQPSGPKSLVEALIDDGYFGEARRIAAVRQRLADRYGRRLSQHDLSPALVRLVREGRLARERSSDGQYLYTSQRA